MQHRFPSVAILLVAGFFVSAEAPRGALVPTTTDPAGLVVHEWGTFTSVAADDGSAVEWVPQLGPQELPCFVERVNMNIKGWLPATVRMETPVLYFYSAEKRTVDVRVKFRRGAVTEWYPRADVFPKEILPASLKLPGLEGTVAWNGVKVLPRADETYPVGDKSNHYYAARKTDASPVEVGNQREKFLFYRGVGNFTVPLSARLSGNGQVTATSSSARPLGDVMLFENQGGTIRFRAAAVEGTVGHAHVAVERGEYRCRSQVAGGDARGARPLRQRSRGDGRDLARLLVRGRAAALLHRRSPRCRRYPAARRHAGADGYRARICRPHRAHHAVSDR